MRGYAKMLYLSFLFSSLQHKINKLQIYSAFTGDQLNIIHMPSILQHSLIYLTYFIIILVPSATCAPPPVTLTLEQAQSKYNKKYKNEEQKTYRRTILESNKKMINDHNKKLGIKYQLGQNMFIDLSPEQFVRAYTGLLPSTSAARQYVRDTAELKAYEIDTCNCSLKMDTKRMDLQKKSSKNKQEYVSTIEKYKNKIKTVDNSLPYSIFPKNRSLPTPSSTTPTTIAKAANLLSQTLITNQTTSTLTVTTITSTVNLPTNDTDIDWTDVAGPIRYQGLCGACYAFTAVQVVQAANSIYLFGGVYIQLSVQQVIDCAVSNLNGCDGGLLEWSYAMMRTTGITANFRYPYTSGTTGTAGTCKTSTGQFKILSYRQLNGTCADLRSQLKSKPVSTPIRAQNMQFYSWGIFIGCSETDPFDHAVVIVGYNSTMGWKFKNSWGTGWGMNGYGWLSLDQRRNCGICAMPVVPKTYNEP